MEAEVEALTALGQYDRALSLAETTTIPEEALLLLATTANQRARSGLQSNPALNDYVNNAYSNVKPERLDRDTLFEVASELVYCYPELATELLTKSLKVSGNKNDLDLAYTHLAAFAALGRERRISGASHAADTIIGKIKSPDLQEFTRVLCSSLDDLDAKQVLRRAAQSGKNSNRLLLMRHWCATNPRSVGAIEVVECALDTALQDSTYSPTPQFLRQIASPLPFEGDKERVAKVLEYFRGQLAGALALGPTVEYVQFVLTLIQVQAHLDPKSALLEILDFYDFVSEQNEIIVRAECAAWFLSCLTIVDADNELEEDLEFRTLVASMLQKDVCALLNRWPGIRCLTEDYPGASGTVLR